MATLVASPKKLELLFSTLATEWRRDTLHLSSTTAIVTHPAYQRIIGLGPQAIPLILHDLEINRGHWFWALTAITGENPVPPSDIGRLPMMRDAWLKWGRETGWLA